MIGGRFEFGDGGEHREFCGFEDVYAVDLVGFDLADGKTNGSFAEFGGDLVSLFGGQLF